MRVYVLRLCVCVFFINFFSSILPFSLALSLSLSRSHSLSLSHFLTFSPPFVSFFVILFFFCRIILSLKSYLDYLRRLSNVIVSCVCICACVCTVFYYQCILYAVYTRVDLVDFVGEGLQVVMYLALART